VLEEAQDHKPVLERIKFLSILGSNPDRLPGRSRNSFFGPDLPQIDTPLVRRNRLRERYNLEVIAEAENLMNRPKRELLDRWLHGRRGQSRRPRLPACNLVAQRPATPIRLPVQLLKKKICEH